MRPYEVVSDQEGVANPQEGEAPTSTDVTGARGSLRGRRPWRGGRGRSRGGGASPRDVEAPTGTDMTGARGSVRGSRPWRGGRKRPCGGTNNPSESSGRTTQPAKRRQISEGGLPLNIEAPAVAFDQEEAESDVAPPDAQWALVVFGLDPFATLQDLEAKFSKCENFLSADIPLDGRGFPKNFGWVTFADKESASKAKSAMARSKIRGCAIQMMFRNSPELVRGIKELPVLIDESEVGEEMKSSGFINAFGEHFASGLGESAKPLLILRDEIKVRFPRETPEQQTFRIIDEQFEWLATHLSDVLELRGNYATLESLESRPYEDRATRTQRNFFFRAICSIEGIVGQHIDSHNGWPYVFPRIPRDLWYRFNLLRVVRNDLTHSAESGLHRTVNLKRLHLFIHQEIDHWSRGLTAMRTKWEAKHERPGGSIGVSGAVTLDV